MEEPPTGLDLEFGEFEELTGLAQDTYSVCNGIIGELLFFLNSSFVLNEALRGFFCKTGGRGGIKMA